MEVQQSLIVKQRNKLLPNIDFLSHGPQKPTRSFFARFQICNFKALRSVFEPNLMTTTKICQVFETIWHCTSVAEVESLAEVIILVL